MSLRDLKWSAHEKKVARAAFDKAYKEEMSRVRAATYEMVKQCKESNDIWRVHNYLREKRREVDRKYDYRYSVLIWVFAELISDDLISIEDLQGLSDDKIAAIKRSLEPLNE